MKNDRMPESVIWTASLYDVVEVLENDPFYLITLKGIIKRYLC